MLVKLELHQSGQAKSGPEGLGLAAGANSSEMEGLFVVDSSCT